MLELGGSPKSIMESVEIGWLPSPPQVFNQLLDICSDPNSSIGDLAYIIGIDAVLTSKLIMAANTAAFEISEPINNLQQAIGLIGLDQVKTMVLTSSIQQLFAGLINTRKKTVCNTWVDSLYCAVFAQAIAEATNYKQTHDAYLAGLLLHFGQIVLDTKFHGQYRDILDEEKQDELVRKEIHRFGVNHSELGACIVERWSSLNPSIADAIRFHHEDEDQLKGCDMLCQIVAEAGQIGWYWSRFGLADDNWHSALVDEEQLKEIYVRVQGEVSQITARLGVSLQAGNFTQHIFLNDIEQESIKLGRKIRDASLMSVIYSNEIHSKPVDSPRSLLLKIAQDLQLVFSISDVVLLFPNAETPDLLTLYEVNGVQPASQFSVNNKESKFVRSFQEKRYLWVEPEQMYGDITPPSDRQILRRLKHDIALSIPLGSDDQVIGTVIIGSNMVQKGYLANQINFITGYLQSNATSWLNNTQTLRRQAFKRDVNEEQEQKDISKLIHEISNPLSVIGNYIDIIKGNSNPDGDESASSREIDILKEELGRIRNIVLNFKDTESINADPVFLNEELEKCIPFYVKSIGNTEKVEIKWDLDQSDCEIKITRDALRQIVLNLVKNAIEAQNESALISVSSHHFVNIDGLIFAQFCIADKGGGIDEIMRQQLFSTLTSGKEGTSRGLGLSVVAEIIDHFDGQIKYMENEFGGASFEVSIPALLTK